MIEVDWNRTVIVDARGNALRVVHSGVSLLQSGSPMVPTVVPSGSAIRELVFPAASIEIHRGAWLATPLFESMKPGSTFSLSVAIEVDRRPETKRFIFSVLPPTNPGDG